MIHSGPVLRDIEANLVKGFFEAESDEEKFLFQQAKIKWLRNRDKNISYFHKVLKGRNNRSKVFSLSDAYGEICSGDRILKLFLKHFEEFLGNAQPVKKVEDCATLFQRRLSPDVAQKRIKDITEKEIKSAMFDINDSKAPGPDGFTVAFFKKVWSIIGNDVCKAI
nr:RNA-directed DNA polymerase, eukaryota, reverse transcriptase zinc-binding domain protein [Tanacetum cinerariifolium]